jgi:hypothetical protein
MKAAAILPEETKPRSSKHPNNAIKQNRRKVKAQTGPIPS